MFRLWHRVREKAVQRSTFQRRMQPVEQRVLRLLRKAVLRAEARTAGMLPSVPSVVLWRKGSFGTDTAEGSRYAERILAAMTTLEQQRRPLRDYLELACRAR